MDKPLIEAKGVGGQLELYEDKIRIKRKGVIGLMGHGLKGDKDIYIKDISSIQFKEPGVMNGYIQFAFLGGREAKGGIWQGTSDENTVFFNSWQKKPFKAIKEALDKQISARSKATPVSNLSDLEKLAGLRDKGIISDEEFQAKKKQLLGI